jgi:hypothetical protein
MVVRALVEIPVALLILGIWLIASGIVMSGSTPDADSFAGLGWKNNGELNVWAIRLEPTV